MPLLRRMNPQLRSACDTTSQKRSLLALEQPLGNVSLKNKKEKCILGSQIEMRKSLILF
jgi:hypothetical protein